MGRGDSTDHHSSILSLRQRASTNARINGQSELDKLGSCSAKQQFPPARSMWNIVGSIQEGFAGLESISEYMAVGKRFNDNHEFFLVPTGYQLQKSLVDAFDTWRSKVYANGSQPGRALLGLSEVILMSDIMVNSPKVWNLGGSVVDVSSLTKEKEEKVTAVVGLLNGAKPLYPPELVEKMFVERVHPQLIFPYLYMNDEIRRDFFQHGTKASEGASIIPTRKDIFDWMTGPIDASHPEWLLQLGPVFAMASETDRPILAGEIPRSMQYPLNLMFFDGLKKYGFDHSQYCAEEEYNWR